MTTMRIAPTLVLILPLLFACDKAGEDSKPAAANEQAKSDAAEPAPAEAAEPSAAYTSYVLAGLGELGSSGTITKAETRPYGCGVKYAEGGEPSQAKVGEPAPAFSLPNLEGAPVALADFKGKTVVIEWFNPDCPFVKYAHEGQGPLVSLGNEQSEAGVVWLAINSGAAGKQGAGVERNKQAKADWKINHPILIDEDGAIGHLYGAKTTPHMYIVDPEGKLVYAGGLDNAPLGEVES